MSENNDSCPKCQQPKWERCETYGWKVACKCIIEPINWQARAEAAEAELATAKEDLEFRRGLFELHLSQLSASQAEVAKLRGVLRNLVECVEEDESYTARGGPIAFREAKKALSPTEEGGAQ